MRVLFWNTHLNSDINQYIVPLVQENDIDVLTLAEYDADISELYTSFRQLDINLIPCNTFGCNKISVWSNYVNIRSEEQQPHYSIHVIRDEIVLCCVHLPSDQNGDKELERLEMAREILQDIEITEKEIGTAKTIIVGDMNEPPYGKACLSANGFHALPSMSDLKKPTRRVQRKTYRKFYNPMWNMMGDFINPPGTYYLNKSEMQSSMWYVVDQIIISRELMPFFKKESLRIITTSDRMDLKNNNFRPNRGISDHFPIMCEFDDNEKE